MAGSFGYETEHYEVSRLIGERRLFPAVRGASPETVLVAPGVLLPAPGGTLHRPRRGASGGVAPVRWPSVTGPGRAWRTHASRAARSTPMTAGSPPLLDTLTCSTIPAPRGSRRKNSGTTSRFPSPSAPAPTRRTPRMPFRISWPILGTPILLLGLVPATGGEPFGLEKRIPWDATRLSGSPEPPLPYTVEKTFTKHSWKSPIYVAEEPGTDRCSGWSRRETRPARARRSCGSPTIPTRPGPRCSSTSPSSSPIPSASTRPMPPTASSTSSATARATCRNASIGSPATPSVARRPAASTRASEVVVIEWKSAGHDGGDMTFGLDGFLYITTGDGTSDSDTWNSGQTLDDLLGSVLRIDVDRRDGDRRYGMPADNPFVRPSRGPPRDLGLRAPQPLAHLHRPEDGPHLGREQRAGPLGDRPPGPARRELRLERLRGEPPVLPRAQARAHAHRAADDRASPRRVPLADRRGRLPRDRSTPTSTAPTSTATTRAAGSGR